MPLSNAACGARGLPASVTEAGPPERMTALGLEALEGGFGALEGMDLAVDARFAHAARDELGHLAAEIDDEDGVGGHWDGWLRRQSGATDRPVKAVDHPVPAASRRAGAARLVSHGNGRLIPVPT